MNTPDTEWDKITFENEFAGWWDNKTALTERIEDHITSLLSSRDTYWKERVRDVKFDIEALRGSPRDTDIEYARAITDVHKILDDIIDNLK